MYTAKEIRLIDLNLLSGSTETFRTAVGGYFEVISSSEGEVLLPTKYLGDGDSEEILSPFITSIKYELDLKEKISDEVMVPNYKFPIRITGHPTTVKDDNFWKIVLLGGEFGGIEYNSIFTDAVFDNLSCIYTLPYSKEEANVINYVAVDAVITDTIHISYDYNQYVPTYENYINNVESDKLIPNMYLFKMYEIETTPEGAIAVSEDIQNFVTLEGAYETPDGLCAETELVIDRLNKDHISYEDSMISTYLSSSIILTPLSSSTKDNIQNIFENIIFDENILTDVVTEEWIDITTSIDTTDDTYINMGDSKKIIPFYMKFGWTAAQDKTTFVDNIVESNFTQKFMKTLKEIFTDQLDDFVPSESTFAIEIKSTIGSLETATYSDVTSTQNGTYKSIDFMEMLIYTHNNFISTMNNCYFLGTDNIGRLAAMDLSGSYRYYNSMNSLEMINSTIDYLNDESNFNIENLSDLYNLDEGYNEVLAYRIEKIGGSPTGDLLTQNVLQNFWFFNTDDFMEGTEFYDSQIRYNTEYTYNVYAYSLKIGAKYAFSDLRLTRAIGSIDEDEDGITDSYCLEFYDPVTDERIEQLFDTDTNLIEENQAATNAQITSTERYLADFYLQYEPTLKLIEIPIFSKTLKIMDHIPNQVNITPYQMIDTTQRIGFTVNYESYNSYLDYPSTISYNDVIIKNDYLHANDYLSSSYLSNASISRQRYIEIYRVDEMPTSISSFDENLLQTIDLRSPQTVQTVSTIEFLNAIQTNKKHYYVFRMLNEQSIPGHLSEIYEAQLINDGGYLYSIFNILFEEDLEQEIFVNPSREFKKIFELQPNVSQLKLDTSEVDFSQPAHTQLENMIIGDTDDTIWNKTFKVRLTSIKTGKKIDLNFTYNLRTD